MNNKFVKKELTTERESFTELLGRLANDVASVVHNEIDLVIQGIREKMSAVRGGAITVAIGAAITFVAFMCLCAALIIELTAYMSPVIAALVTGAAFALIGLIIALIGYKQLKKQAL